MAAPPRTDALLRETLRLRTACHGNVAEMARQSGVAEMTLKHRIADAKRRFPKLFKEFPVAMGGRKNLPPKASPTLQDDVQSHKDREAKQFLQSRVKESAARIAELEAEIARYRMAGNVTTKPAEWTLDSRAPKRKSPHIPVLFFSDAQAGEVVRTEETDTPWAYDSNIFRQRYRKMISVVHDLSFNHAGTRWTYPGIVYVRGGDNVSGGLHEDLRELGEDCTVIEQCELVYAEEAAGIAKMAELFGRVEVQTPGAAGNHDRTTQKPPTKLAWARSFDRLIHSMLVNKFTGDKRVSFHVTKSPDVRFPIFGRNFLCTHGDRTGTGGGMGFAGPGLPILRGWQKVIAEQAALGYRVDVIMTGHVHYPMALPIGFGNGSFTGTTEFGKKFRLPPQAPMQYLFYNSPDHGTVDIRPIYLA